ncbi:MAG: hypothetical protein ACXVNF_15950 [Neobacillus sp.]
MSPLVDKAWITLGVTASFLVIKLLMADVASGEFLWHKFGYDNCVMSFGATLTALGLQLTSKDDIFQGLSSIVLLGSLSIFSDPIANRSLQLFFFLLLALGGTLLTAIISGYIKKNQAKGVTLLSFLNSIIGAILLALYVLILITKG